MRVALLSDIHGNACALKAVLAEIEKENISTLLIAGDFIGYYYDVADSLRLLEAFQIIVCKGNHEALFKEWLEGEACVKNALSSQYGQSFAVASRELTPQQIAWLVNLPHPVSWTDEKKRILLSHGSPWDVNCYLYEDRLPAYLEQVKAATLGYDVLIIGHTHYQFVKEIAHLLIVSPGSVGQPRSGKLTQEQSCEARAQWATLCCQTGNVTLKTTFYSPAKLMKKIARYDNELSYLKSVLLRR